MNPEPRYCEDFESGEVGSPLCYAAAVVEAYFDGEWRPVCSKHAKDHEARRVASKQLDR